MSSQLEHTTVTKGIVDGDCARAGTPATTTIRNISIAILTIAHPPLHIPIFVSSEDCQFDNISRLGEVANTNRRQFCNAFETQCRRRVPYPLRRPTLKVTDGRRTMPAGHGLLAWVPRIIGSEVGVRRRSRPRRAIDFEQPVPSSPACSVVHSRHQRCRSAA
jgi:hypothetical protein